MIPQIIKKTTEFKDILKKYQLVFNGNIAKQKNTEEWEKNGNYEKMRIANGKRTVAAKERAHDVERKLIALKTEGMSTKEALTELGVPYNTWKSWKYLGYVK